ncbi:MAG: hypothetical protein ACW97W_04185 [Candidatus Hodarchaeales archaeon]|jgi:hypothetical protein
MVKKIRKTWWATVLLLIMLPIIFNGLKGEIQSGSAYIPGEIWIDRQWRTPTTPDVDQSVDIYVEVGHTRSPSYISATLYYNYMYGNDIIVSMPETSTDGVYKATIPGFPYGVIVRYKIKVMGEVDAQLFSMWSPSATSYHTYTVTEPSEISWSSPVEGTEFTYGPVNNNIEFNFDWTYDNLDSAHIQIGEQQIPILTSGVKSTQVILDGTDLDGSTLDATLKGYKAGALVASTVRTFSFRRLNYDLAWETPSDGNTIAFSPSGPAKFNFSFSIGFDIDHVKLFFNGTDMGEVTSPGTVEFTFENFDGIVIASLKAYNSSDNEVAISTYNFIFRRLIIEVIWETPSVNSSITYGIGIDPVQFNLTYSKGTDVNYVKLELNGINMGLVASPGSVIFSYNDTFHGGVEAILIGFDEYDTQISTDTRYFKFDKYSATRFEILQQNEIDLGNKLYLILHDPNGDDSTSSYEESTTLSMGIGCEITAGVTAGLEVGIEQEANFFGLFSSGGSASTKLSLSAEASVGFDARFEMTDSTFLSSSDSSYVDFIGPGYGDRYWGELWKLKYVFTIHYIEYYNTTEVYYDPHLWWGILRDAEAYISDASAPAAWKAMNPVHSGYSEEDVEWIGGALVSDGGGTYHGSEEVTNTNTMSSSISIGIESETKAKLIAGGAYVEGSLELSLNTKVYAEKSVSNTIRTSYTIRDDDPLDSIVQKVGIDKNFGTYIFKTESDFSSTSNPIEHNTRDYVPPIIGYPTIIYDTDQDFKGPTPNDNPLVTVKIEEEGGMQDAILYYTNDNRTSWRSISLIEYQGQPGVWATNIPKQANHTEVLWYLKAIDLSGNVEEKYDLTGSYFSYEVGILVNPFIAQTPGFTIWTVLASIGLGVYLISKRRE